MIISRLKPVVLCVLASAQAVQMSLLPRDSTCINSSFRRCSDSRLPSNFCCPADTECISLNDATSMLCCPGGQSCQFIAPITCDISQQDATLHPQNPVLSTNVSISLATCGKGCCPQGFSCDRGQCSLEKQTSGGGSSSSSPSSAAPTSAPTLATPTSSTSSGDASTSTSSTSSLSASTPAKSATQEPATASSPSKSTENAQIRAESFPAKAIVAGFFPGIAAGVMLGVAGMMWLRRRKRISAPIYQSQDVCRTDFLRKGSDERAQLPPLVTRAPTTKSMSAKSEATSMEFVLSATPGRSSHMTAFTDLMEGAGFRRGEPYLVAADSRTRGG